ncbi:unnamed protein product, partial [Rotaria sordida]
MKSSLLTSLDNVSNTPTITSTSTNNIIDITSTQEVFEDNLSSTSDTVHQTTNLEVVSTDFDIQSTIVSGSTILSTRVDTTINQDKSTVSHNVTELISTSAESSLSEQITTYISKTTFVTLTNAFDDTSNISDQQTTSTLQNTNKMSTIDDTTVRSITSIENS